MQAQQIPQGQLTLLQGSYCTFSENVALMLISWEKNLLHIFRISTCSLSDHTICISVTWALSEIAIVLYIPLLAELLPLLAEVPLYISVDRTANIRHMPGLALL